MSSAESTGVTSSTRTTSSTGTTTDTSAPAPGRSTTSAVLRTAGVAAAVAVVVNLLLLLVGRLAGGEMVLTPAAGGASQTVGVVPVVVATLVGLGLGAVLLLVVGRRGPRAWSAVAVLGLVGGVVTTPAPLMMSADTATHAALVAMHVLTGVVWFLVVRRGARR